MFEKIEKYVNSNIYFTNSVGLARTLLSIGLLITLTFNNTDELFNINIDGVHSIAQNEYNFFSLFIIFKNLEIARIISVAILLFVATGFYPRYTSFLHFWVSFSYTSCVQIIDGGDQIMTILTFLLIPICLANPSKSHWKPYKTSNFYSNTISYYGFLLIKIQAFIIYFHAAVGKFVVPEWINGTAIYYWFSDPVFGANKHFKPILFWIFKKPLLTFYLNWSVLFLELFISFAIFYPNYRIKKLALILGLIFHFFIVIIHGLTSFYFSMASLLILSLWAINKNILNQKYVSKN